MEERKEERNSCGKHLKPGEEKAEDEKEKNKDGQKMEKRNVFKELTTEGIN